MDTTNRPILCIDDEPSNLALMRNVLQADYKLVFARNGAETLQAVAKHNPALLLMDVNMPDLNGFEVARRLKADPATSHIPIIFVSGSSDELDEQAGFDAGGVDYITKPISAAIVRARVRTHLSLVKVAELEASHLAAVHMLGEAGHYNDNDTGVHIWRMAAYCRLLALAMGWSVPRAELLGLTAPMHDTGKIGISDVILKKPGTLNAAEWEIMKTHSQIGHDILSKSDSSLFRLAAEVALNHHEKWDGSGYPRGLSGLEIPESARIVAIADVFDALAMKRPYKDAWPLDRITALLQESSGLHFEPRLVETFLQLLPQLLEEKMKWDAREVA